MQPLAPLSGRHLALMQPLAPLSGRHLALMQPPAPLTGHNTPFQPFFTQQRRHRFQRPHTTNWQRCHWLQIPPVACQISKIAGSAPSTHATVGTTVGPAPSTHATAGTTVGSAPSTHATTGTTVGPQHPISAVFRSTEASPVSKTAYNQLAEVSLVADPACSLPTKATPLHPHETWRQIPHRIRTTPSGLDNSHIIKTSTSCT